MGFQQGSQSLEQFPLGCCGRIDWEWDGLVWQSREWEVNVAKIQVEMEARKAEERESSGWF